MTRCNVIDYTRSPSNQQLDRQRYVGALRLAPAFTALEVLDHDCLFGRYLLSDVISSEAIYRPLKFARYRAISTGT